MAHEESGALHGPHRRDGDAPGVPGQAGDQALPLAEALARAVRCFAELPGTLEAARVHDQAFGRLIDAQRVRDAYHERLPATEENLAAAHDSAEHLLARLAQLVDPAARQPGTVVGSQSGAVD